VIDQADSPYEAFPELRCTLSNNSVVPDITVIHQNRVPSENIPISGAPEWIIEILSPEQSTTKLIAKIQACLEEGTKLGWLIDSTERVIMVLLPDRRLTLLSHGDHLPVLQGTPLALTVDQVFAWLPPLQT
jgi:Uma2 family endonuclease